MVLKFIACNFTGKKIKLLVSLPPSSHLMAVTAIKVMIVRLTAVVRDTWSVGRFPVLVSRTCNWSV